MKIYKWRKGKEKAGQGTLTKKRKQVQIKFPLVTMIERLGEEEERGIGDMVKVLLTEALKARGKI